MHIFVAVIYAKINLIQKTLIAYVFDLLIFLYFKTSYLIFRSEEHILHLYERLTDLEDKLFSTILECVLNLQMF